METGRVLNRWSVLREGVAPLSQAGTRVGAERGVDLEALYDAFGGPLYRYLVALLGSTEEAEDALQEVFLGLLRRPRQRPIEDLRAYLFRAARNQAMGVLRRRRRREETAPEASWIDSERLAYADRELAVDVDRALRQLPPAQREVLLLKLGEGLTFREIAALLGVRQNTAASRYRLAIARLRTLLGGDDDDG
jgi:RNA polymerase sigma-70 factor (ECF subfamily)